MALLLATHSSLSDGVSDVDDSVFSFPGKPGPLDVVEVPGKGLEVHPTRSVDPGLELLSPGLLFLEPLLLFVVDVLLGPDADDLSASHFQGKTSDDSSPEIVAIEAVLEVFVGEQFGAFGVQR